MYTYSSHTHNSALSEMVEITASPALASLQLTCIQCQCLGARPRSLNYVASCLPDAANFM